MADYNRDRLGINVIPTDTQTRSEYPSWSNWQDKPIPQSMVVVPDRGNGFIIFN
jgi:hypothetical protein